MNMSADAFLRNSTTVWALMDDTDPAVSLDFNYSLGAFRTPDRRGDVNVFFNWNR